MKHKLNEKDRKELLHLIRGKIPGIRAAADEPMAEHTTFRTGGPAAVFAEPGSEEDLRALLRLASESGAEYFILGKGSNLLVSDRGYNGLVIHIGDALSGVEVHGCTIEAGAGTALGNLAAAARKNALTGLEFAGGIPGSFGGGLRMNAGAYGGEMKDVLVSAAVMDQTGCLKVLGLKELGMRYRGSRIADEELIVVRGTVELKEGRIPDITAYMQELAEKRRSRQPLEFPSAGSTFKRPPGYFAGKLIEDAGLKGFRVGGACVSVKHCGFVVNDSGATTADILAVCREVRRRVFEDAGVLLEPEVRFLGEDMDL